MRYKVYWLNFKLNVIFLFYYLLFIFLVLASLSCLKKAFNQLNIHSTEPQSFCRGLKTILMEQEHLRQVMDFVVFYLHFDWVIRSVAMVMSP